MTDQEISQFAKRLQDAGIQLTAVYEPIGCNFGLRAGDLPLYLRDRDEFFAQECAVTKTEYQDWKAYVKAGRPCFHQGKSGACGQSAAKTAEISPHDYVERKKIGNLLCSRHQKEKEEKESV